MAEQLRYITHGPEASELVTEALPVPQANEVLVKTSVSLVSVGTEVAYLQKGKRRQGRSGYSAVGTITAVGRDAPGDRKSVV